jgi:hypothetical protein
MVTLPDTAWALCRGTESFSLPPTQTKVSEARTIQSAWTMYANGMTADPRGGYWIACSQGLVEFDQAGAATGRRLGGLPGVSAMAVAPDGTLVVLTEDGQEVKGGMRPTGITSAPPWLLVADEQGKRIIRFRSTGP